MTVKKDIKYRKMKKLFDCVAKNVGCMQNSEKKAPKDPPIIILF